MPARPIPSAVREKIMKLLPMLSSPVAGEAAAAAAAIGRVLEGAGLDWHDFTAAFAPDSQADAPWDGEPQWRDVGGRAPRRSAPRSRFDGPPPGMDGWTPIDAGDLLQLIEDIKVNSSPAPSSIQFLIGLEERAGRYNPVYLSPKQITWLMDLARAAGVTSQHRGQK
jgi:hypothetical protein